MINLPHQSIELHQLYVCIACVFNETNFVHAQLIKSNADVFCLQEVWLPEQQQQIYHAVKRNYPYIASAIDLEQDIRFNKTPACDFDNLLKFYSCTETNCKNVTEAEIFTCSGIHCYHFLNLLSSECNVCLFVAARGLECLSDPTSLYQQTLGMMLLSKFELTDVHIQSYTPEADDHASIQGYIEANVSLPPFMHSFLYETHGN